MSLRQTANGAGHYPVLAIGPVLAISRVQSQIRAARGRHGGVGKRRMIMSR